MGFQTQVNYGCTFSLTLNPNFLNNDLNTVVFGVEVTYGNSKRAANDKPSTVAIQSSFTLLAPQGTTGSAGTTGYSIQASTTSSTSSSSVAGTTSAVDLQQGSPSTHTSGIPAGAIAGPVVGSVGIIVAIIAFRKRKQIKEKITGVKESSSA